MKEKKQLEIETKIKNTNNQTEARIGQAQNPPGKELVNCIFSYRIAWSK